MSLSGNGPKKRTKPNNLDELGARVGKTNKCLNGPMQGKVSGRRMFHLSNPQLLSLFLCFVIVSIPVICICIGYLIGSYFMPPPTNFPDPGIVMDMTQLNYSWYNSHNLTINFNGGLGNQMFQYASLYGIGKANGLKPVIAEKCILTRTFRTLRAQLTNETNFGKSFGFYHERKPSAFDSRTFSLNFMRNIRLEGYFQSWRYFDHIRSDLRKQFTFKSSTMQKTDEFLQESLNSYLLLDKDEISRSDVKFVGIHVRRGDFLESYNANKGYSVADRNYLTKAMKYFENKYKHVVFIVCSDDIPWTVENVKSSEKSLVVFSKFFPSPQHDLCLLSRCNHTIITGGTFGWWGAWLAGGQTIYYKDYPNPMSLLRDAFRLSDYYIPQWIAM